MKASRVTGPGLPAAVAAVLVSGAILLGADAVHAGDRKKMSGRIDAPVLFHNYCSVCHGDNGDGNSRARNSLVPPPTNFTDEKLQGKLTPEYIAAIVKHGKPGTAMVGWKTQLSDAEISELAGYVRATFVAHAGDAALRRGRTLYGQYCVACHGVNGTAVATAGAASTPAPRDLTTESSKRELSRERIVAAVAVGRKGTAMTGFAGPMSATDIDAVADYVQKWLMSGQSTAISGASAHGGRARDAAK